VSLLKRRSISYQDVWGAGGDWKELRLSSTEAALGVSAVRELADIHEADAAARAWVRSAVKGDAGAVVVGGVDVVREGGRA
jgi:hypothetical protein